MTYIYRVSSPLGGIVMSGQNDFLTGLWFEGQRSGVQPCEERLTPVFEQTVRWLEQYFCGRAPGFTPPMALEGTPFRKAVWDILLSIPFGQTMTYGQIAAMIAASRGLTRMSAQAVGGAVGHNPISLIVPCHRVIGSDGGLTGYGGGLDRKRRLLELEGILPPDYQSH